MNRREIPVDPLAALYEPIIRHRPSPFVIAQLGQSLDGRIATPTGKSRDINGCCGMDHLHRLRAIADVVVVGVGTVLADDPQLTTRRVPGRSPARAVIDPSGRSSRQSRWLREDGCRRIVFSENAHGWPDEVERIGTDHDPAIFEPARLIAALAARGHRTVLVEGGASTISRFIDAGVVDRLHVCLSPIILGSGRPGLDLRPIDELDDALRPRARTYLLDDGNILYDCDLRSAADGGADVVS
ncbi:bifunctional deaminase-reductase domain protein [Ancylobacter novellus DSM 506]|uniref:Bifunctional deaminase-reductase domain protein n=1 Tax=Ancylobacter novellus (strain ATCC 8093 / DSM 506 / JCM 20403 / CCM 1077 / IAM 12100 / NBRC 12443 / NCIMB 10456) TaxID=639283 RepID=D7AAZ1_ANCN5|nr:RibD family protein [Ancylobacter novellus]ADH91008.1 bifunctional deaminase-reductase domain protein [Ancylobacter novellus DSM 506]